MNTLSLWHNPECCKRRSHVMAPAGRPEDASGGL
jgi:hypothetical protein